ncbi:MAG: hypothetical protein FJ134_14605 [Deltaproteobacteria bacterium]|nr:hypothetical protein [Deltaproteobacteria bacterium]
MKVWWRSKTIWLNFIALLAAVLQARYGLVVDATAQGVILTGINIFLRTITKESIGLQMD